MQRRKWRRHSWRFQLGSAYTPGLTVSGDLVVRRVRRLPIKGEVLVKKGDTVQASDIVAQANLPGNLQTMKLADKLGVENRDVKTLCKLNVGDTVTVGQIIAETKGFFGIGAQKIACEFEGTVDTISEISGQLLIREPAIPINVQAYIQGVVADILPEEGAIIETRGAMVQGIFGIGGERQGVIHIAVSSPGEVLDAKHITESDKGKFLVGGSCVTIAAIRQAEKVGALGIITGGILDSDLIDYLGYDIGVAITGSEPIPLTVVVTEGFGELNMAERTFKLLQSLQGKVASINGATQIRAGVIRPELIVPLELSGESQKVASSGGELQIGTPIRVIREPYFGRLGTVTALPANLEVVESGTEVRVLHAKLEDGHEVTVPRANVEILAT